MKLLKMIALSTGLTFAFCSGSYAIEDDRYDDYPLAERFKIRIGGSNGASGLGVLDFMKRTSLLKLDAASLKALGPAAMTLARAEGLDAHRRSVAIRLNLLD